MFTACLLSMTLYTAPPSLLDVRYRAGDEAEWSEPGFDDSEWDTVAPDQITGAGGQAERLWFRFHVQVDDLDESVAIVTGAPLAQHWQTFLNGHLIKSGGGDELMDHMVTWLPEAWELPRAYLRPGRNVVAIRLEKNPMMGNGLMGTRAAAGSAGEMHALAKRLSSLSSLQQGIVFGLLAGAILFLVGLAWTGDAAGRWALGLTASIAMTAFGVSDVPVLLDMSWLFRVCMAGPAFLPGTLAAVLGILTWGRITRLVQALLLVGVGVAVGMFLVETIDTFNVLGAIVAILHATSLIWCVWSAYRVPIVDWQILAVALVGHIVAVIWSILDTAVTVDALVYPGDLGLSIALVCVTAVVIRRRRRLLETTRREKLQAHDRERERIARDLHDGAGQAVAVLKIQTDLLKLRSTDSVTKDALAELTASAAAVGQELQKAVAALRSFDGGLAALAARTRRAGPKVALVEEQTELSPGTYEHVLRIAQEAVGNALKHASPHTIRIELIESAGGARLRVDNDGGGFTAPADAGGTGLQSMRERAALFGGSLALGPHEDGTRVELQIPRRAAS